MRTGRRPTPSSVLAVAAVTVPTSLALGLGVVGAPGVLAWCAALVVGVALTIAWYLWDRYPIPLIAFPIGALLMPLFTVAGAVDPAIALLGAHPRSTLDEAARSTDPVVAVTDATARVELGSAGVVEGGSHRALPRGYTVAPLVSASWAPSTPITAWIICNDEAACTEQLTRTPLVGVVRRGETLASAQGGEIIQDAMAKHGLHVDEPFLAIHVSAHPRLEAAAAVAGSAIALLLLGGLAVFITRFRAKAQRARGGA